MIWTGVVLSKSEIRKRCKKHGQCKTCETKCFEKHIFKTIPITGNDVLEGQCLRCYPLSASQLTSQKNQSLAKSDRSSWKCRSRGELFRTHSSDKSSFSGKSDSATYYRTSKSISASVVAMVDNPIPTHITYQEQFIQEQEKDNFEKCSLSGKSNSATCYRTSKSISKLVLSMVNTAIPVRIIHEQFVIEENGGEDDGNSSFSGMSDNATCNRLYKSNSTSVVSFAIPTHIRYCELFTIEEEEDVSSNLVPVPVNTRSKLPINSAIFSQTIEVAADLQSQQEYRAQKSTGADVDHEQQNIYSCNSVTYNSLLSYCELFTIEEEEDVSSNLVTVPVNTRSKLPTNSAIFNQIGCCRLTIAARV